MVDFIGTSGGDRFQFGGTLQTLSVTLINPYSGQEVEVDEEKNVNFDRFYGGGGFDRIEMTDVGDVLFLENQDTGEQMVFDVEFIQGRAGGDVINFASITIDYSQGILINGGDEDDILWGNIGDDTINGVDGNDNLDGGPGNDRLDGFTGDDLIYGGDGDDSIYGDTLTPNINITGDDTVFAGAGNDLVRGGYGDDILHGDEGNDDIDGEFGDDIIYGGAGNDIINGSDGNDILIGGTGGDDSDFLTIITNSHEFSETLVFPELVERTKIQNLSPPGTANLGVVSGDLSVETQTTAKITFLESGASYRNTLGFYNISADGTIQSAEIAFANVHRSVAQPGLEHTVSLPGSPDTDFGFFIIANGFIRNHNYQDLDIYNPANIDFIYKYGTVDERAAKVTDNADDIDLVYDDGTTELSLKGNIYHTHERGGDGINLNLDNAEHVVSGLVEDGDTSKLRIGFEDLKNLGDADFNDVVFDLEIEDTFSTEVAVEDNDIIDGGAGEDIIWGGYGNDILTGGADSDIFLFNTFDFSIDTITDFETGIGGDSLNLTDILDGYDPNDIDDAISDFIQLTSSGSDTIVSVNSDGEGNDFVDIAVIQNGVGGASVDTLFDDGNIVVDQVIVI